MALTILFTAGWPNFGQAEEKPEALPEESHPGISLEPMYSEAVIAYNSKQPAEALKILDVILKTKPDYLEALELKALVLKSIGKPEESQANYEALIKSSPPEKTGPYHFELGVILFNAKKGAEAVPHFEEAIARSFNVDASHFFLGLHYFGTTAQAGKIGEAQKHFEAVASGSSDELKPAAHYYMGLISYKAGNGSEGTFELIEARSIAKGMGDNPLAKDIGDAVDKVLAPLAKANWFGNATLLGSYNSNVSTAPNDSSTIQQQGANIETPQALVVAGFGRMSSPLDALQWVASYRLTTNFNTNSKTTDYDFLAHTFDLYLTRNPLARTQYGLKLEGNLNFQNRSGTYGWYSKTGEFGPYLRREMGRGKLLSLELYYRPGAYEGGNAEDSQSGHGLIFRSTFQNDRSEMWWNPTYTVGIERNRTDGTTYRNYVLDLLLSDAMHLDAHNTVTASATLNFYFYEEGSIKRYDKLFTLRANWMHTFENAHWSALGDLAYTNNFSNLPETYHYTQIVVSSGIGYNF